MNDNNQSDWFEDYAEGADELQVEEYDITATPNDFNVSTIYNFIESGAVRIPGFQRNFVWDIGRASKLIESLLLGLPVPQLFLYEEARNKFLVIDGQQRLMSIYYFVKQRFPKKDKRVDLRRIFDKEGRIPDEVLHDDTYFSNFKLKLPEKLPNYPNKFKGLNYSMLGDYKTQFELRPIRNIIIKQSVPKDDDSSMYEVFNRLNTGGMNLRPQEIRTSMYNSKFYEMLYQINSATEWRRLLKSPEPDLHMKDVEILLRGFAMLIKGDEYVPSMIKFLNQFSRDCQTHTTEQNEFLHKLFVSFLKSCENLPDDAFLNKKNRRFNIALYEAVFSATCKVPFKDRKEVEGKIGIVNISTLEDDPEFLKASLEGTTRTTNVEKRLERANAILELL